MGFSLRDFGEQTCLRPHHLQVENGLQESLRVDIVYIICKKINELCE